MCIITDSPQKSEKLMHFNLVRRQEMVQNIHGFVLQKIEVEIFEMNQQLCQTR